MRTALNIFYTLLVIFSIFSFTVFESGCAQIGAPTGGPKDTIPPVLVNANPKQFSTNISSNKITLTFDEYVDVKDAQTDVLVSPYPKKNPSISFKLKTVTIKLKDSLQPNTTYSIDFGNAIRDNNEGNILKNFKYVFSTGNKIDSTEISGKIIIAETGKTDSTIMALLYKNAYDSSVQKRKPDYMTTVKSDGSFHFSYLPKDKYRIYALKDGDGGKTYNSPTEMFAFADSDITTNNVPAQITLYAYQSEKETPKKKESTIDKNLKQKKFKYTLPRANNGDQDLLSDFIIEFSNHVKKFNADKIILTDTLYQPIIAQYSVQLDTLHHRRVFVNAKWKENTFYKLIINKDVATDSTDSQISKTDTISFKTKAENEYGNVILRFTNLDLSKHPVILFLQSDQIVRSIPILSSEWSDKLFPPGEYELRILYDENNNGQWDPGNYGKKLQPEKAITLDKKINIKADWDNEREIQL